jgi:hypothetical protein
MLVVDLHDMMEQMVQVVQLVVVPEELVLFQVDREQQILEVVVDVGITPQEMQVLVVQELL